MKKNYQVAECDSRLVSLAERILTERVWRGPADLREPAGDDWLVGRPGGSADPATGG